MWGADGLLGPQKLLSGFRICSEEGAQGTGDRLLCAGLERPWEEAVAGKAQGSMPGPWEVGGWGLRAFPPTPRLLDRFGGAPADYGRGLGTAA